MADLAVQTFEVITPGGANAFGVYNIPNQILQVAPSATSATPTGAAQTIVTNTGIISRVTPSGACTTAILQKGLFNGQIVIVANLSQTVANTVTFDVPANSNVWDDGTNPPVLKAGTAKMFYWDTTINATGAWVPFGPFAG